MQSIEAVMHQWRAKLKHFLILSSAGKPIYSRHGDDQLITNYIGVVQTIISFYQSTNDTLRGFTAGQVRFVVISKGPLNLVAITRLPESDSQLRSQLEALYMQILSTLTLPSMERMFAARANYDLRRPLQGTETLLSALADGFTRGSPSTLLSALECLKLRKSHRATINNTLLKTRSENLLYGLVVASGKLVSVVRPKKHSLHPGDLHLIFNMLFEAGSVKAGGGENWIPLCLPGFNNTGYLYMYVSFLNLEHPSEQMQERPRTSEGADDEVAVLLISADRESFFELRRMRDDLVEVCGIISLLCKVSLFQFRTLGSTKDARFNKVKFPPHVSDSCGFWVRAVCTYYWHGLTWVWLGRADLGRGRGDLSCSHGIALRFPPFMPYFVSSALFLCLVCPGRRVYFTTRTRTLAAPMLLLTPARLRKRVTSDLVVPFVWSGHATDWLLVFGCSPTRMNQPLRYMGAV